MRSKILLILLFIVGYNNISYSQEIEMNSFSIEICSDSTPLSCWSIRDNNFGGNGMFYFDNNEIKNKYNLGYFIFDPVPFISNYRIDTLLVYKEIDTVTYFGNSFNLKNTLEFCIESSKFIDTIIKQSKVKCSKHIKFQNRINNDSLFANKIAYEISNGAYIGNNKYNVNEYFYTINLKITFVKLGISIDRMIINYDKISKRRRSKKYLEKITIPLYFVTSIEWI